MIKREKSCGVLVLRQQEEELYVVLLRHRFGGHWSFPKGHVEAGESERQTALREVREETGLSGIKLLDGFRESVEYSPKPGVKKQVVYFLGTTQQEKLVRQEEEISEIMWAPLSRAADLVSFANDKRLIRHAQRRMGLLPAEPAQAAEPAGEEKAPLPSPQPFPSLRAKPGGLEGMEYLHKSLCRPAGAFLYAFGKAAGGGCGYGAYGSCAYPKSRPSPTADCGKMRPRSGGMIALKRYHIQRKCKR